LAGALNLLFGRIEKQRSNLVFARVDTSALNRAEDLREKRLERVDVTPYVRVVNVEPRNSWVM